jgi:hypothetical protein
MDRTTIEVQRRGVAGDRVALERVRDVNPGVARDLLRSRPTTTGRQRDDRGE